MGRAYGLQEAQAFLQSFLHSVLQQGALQSALQEVLQEAALHSDLQQAALFPVVAQEARPNATAKGRRYFFIGLQSDKIGGACQGRLARSRMKFFGPDEIGTLASRIWMLPLVETRESVNPGGAPDWPGENQVPPPVQTCGPTSIPTRAVFT